MIQIHIYSGGKKIKTFKVKNYDDYMISEKVLEIYDTTNGDAIYQWCGDFLVDFSKYKERE
jgi:hypothetical protein